VSLFSTFFISTLIVLASIAVFGADLWLSWIAFLPSFQSGLFERFEQYARFIPSVLFSAMLAGTGFATAMVLQVVAAGVGVAACAWAYSRSRDLALQCAVLLVGTLLTAPYTFNYDLVFVSVAVLILFEYGRSRGFLAGELLVLTCAWLAAMLDGMLGVLAGVTVSPAVVTALLPYLLMRIGRDHRTRSLHLGHSLTA
jgi:hypothetical protein